MSTSIRTLPPPDTFSSRQAVSPPQPPLPAQHSAVVVTSLAQLRPGPRRVNEYVDSPRSRPSIQPKTQLQSPAIAAVGGGGLSTSSPRFRSSGGAITNGGGGLHNINSHHHHQQLSLHQLASTRSAYGTSLSSPNTTSLTTSGSPVLVVSRQPLSKSPPLKKDAGDSPIIPLDGYGRDADGGGLQNAGVGTVTSSTLATSASGGGGRLSSQLSGSGVRTSHGGIICEDCHKCRCGACTERRELPCGTWCCGGKCELTPAKVLDVCTCFCAVKCLFFHCRRGEEEEDDNECYENPCGCTETPRCCQRWTVLGLMSACLPCLWTYWPARACLAASTAAYNSCCRHKGCQCELKLAENASAATSAGSTAVGGGSGSLSATKSVLSTVRGGGGVIGGAGTKNSKHSQARRLLIESDSSSA